MLGVLGVALAAADAGGAAACVKAKNFVNAQYTVEINLGNPPQTLDAVADTGSFELIVTSQVCTGCEPHRYFNSSNSSTFRKRGMVVETHFGQGLVRSEANYDEVRLGRVRVTNQSVLLMQVNELRGFAEASYDAVMGLGVKKFARANDSDLSLMSSMGADIVSVCCALSSTPAPLSLPPPPPLPASRCPPRRPSPTLCAQSDNTTARRAGSISAAASPAWRTPRSPSPAGCTGPST